MTTTYMCIGCGTGFVKKYPTDSRARKYCTTACCYSHRVGAKHANWTGGRSVLRSGYVRLAMPKDYGKKFQLEHRVVAEAAMGRRLKETEHVHHINGDKQDNDRRNLLVCSNAYHRELERRMATLYQREKFPSFTLSV